MSNPANYDEQLKYYTERYDEVHVVTCDKCGSPLAFEVKGGVDNAGDPSHPDGRQVIPVSYKDHPQGMALASWRPRLDGHIGYQCIAIVDNPDYDKAVKALKAEYVEIKKRVDSENKEANRAYEEAVKAYPKLLADYKKAAKKDPGTIALNPVEPTKPEPMAYPDMGEPAEDPTKYCLNDTRIAPSERYQVPVSNSAGGGVPTMLPFEREAVSADIAASGKQADVEVKGNVKRVESFKIERVK